MATLEEVFEEMGVFDCPELTIFYENQESYFAGVDADDILIEFVDSYCGRFDTWLDFVREFAYELGLFEGLGDYDDLFRYFNYEAFGHDILANGSHFYGQAAGHVYVFRSL